MAPLGFRGATARVVIDEVTKSLAHTCAVVVTNGDSGWSIAVAVLEDSLELESYLPKQG